MNTTKTVWMMGHRVTLIGPSPYHYYSGMGPGLLSGIYRPQDVRFHVKKMAEDRGAFFIQDAVIRIDSERKVLILHSGNEIKYDVVSFNTGSHVPMDSNVVSNNTIFPVKPVVNLLKARQVILDLVKKGAPRLVVIGGGPAALEIAGTRVTSAVTSLVARSRVYKPTFSFSG